MNSEFKSMLVDVGLSAKEMQDITNSGNLLEIESVNYIKKKSSIHGYGVFAKKHIKKGEFIGIGSLGETYKLTLGRWVNHSNKNNSMFYFNTNKDYLLFSTEHIKKGKEILINYRHNALEPKTITI
tara:strand:- start:774 stop:1151 length:378 start_codon:yes stop_codon:yes gene_type:complete